MEVGLTVALLIGADLLLKSYQRLRAADMGCATENVLTMRFGLPGVRYKTPGPMPVNFFNELLAARARHARGGRRGPGQCGAGAGLLGRLQLHHRGAPPAAAGLPGYSRSIASADAGYFAAMGIPILRGRTFNDSLRLDDANEIIITDSS